MQNLLLEGKNVKAGDTTAVTIDGPIDIKSQDFEINDTITGKKIADAKVDAKSVRLLKKKIYAFQAPSFSAGVSNKDTSA